MDIVHRRAFEKPPGEVDWHRYCRRSDEATKCSVLLLDEVAVAVEVSLGAIITSIRDLKTCKGERMAVVQVEDLD